jgi:hypothetical protein
LKAFAIILILANGVAFAWWNGFLSSWLGDGREPERTTTQVAAANARLVPLSRLAPLPIVPVFALCIDYPVATDAKANELEKQIRSLVTEKASTLKLERETTTEGGTFLVYLSPSPTIREAQRKLFELKRVGVEDVALINEGDLKWAISLGVFSTDDAVRTRIAQLSRVGIPGVKTSARSPIVNRVAFKAKVTDAEMKAALMALSNSVLNAEAKTCPV